MAGLYRFVQQAGDGGRRLDRDGLLQWARQRFHIELDLDDLKNKQRDEIRELLIAHSGTTQSQANEKLQLVKNKVASLFANAASDQTVDVVTGGNGALDSFTKWLHDTLQCDIPADEIADLDRTGLEQRLCNIVEDRFRPEMRRLERSLLLEIVDNAWKDHLLAMDHLKSSIGLSGYAQLDPKVEYKREGMRMFQQMWRSIGERVTDLIFRMESLDESFVSSTWIETSASHEQATPSTEIARQQQSAIDSSQSEGRIDPIRNRSERVGRNDPCPCGSGKKYKNCCLRRQGQAT